MRSGERGALALAWDESVVVSGGACAVQAPPARRSLELERLLELVRMLERGSDASRRLAAALRRSRAPARLLAADVEGFTAALDLIVRQLWPTAEVPFELAWALQAVGLDVTPAPAE